MSLAFVVGNVGLGLALMGTIVLASSLGAVLRELQLAISLVDLTLEGMVNWSGDLARARSIEKRLARSLTRARRSTIAGLLLIGLGFALQLCCLWLQRHAAR